MRNRRIRIIALLIAVIMTVAMLSGCALKDFFATLIGFDNTDEKADYLLNTVYDYLNDKWVTELTEEEKEKIILAGCNAMLSAVDKYGRVLTPEEYYELLYPSTITQSGEYFGFTFYQLKYLGLYVSGTMLDSPVYGILQSGDVIIDIDDEKGESLFYVNEDNEKKPLNVRVASLEIIKNELLKYNTLTITYIRGGTEENCYEDGERLSSVIKRGGVSNPNGNDFEFVQYYFGSEYRNVSDKTIELKDLAELDGTNIGYISLSEFSTVYDGKTLITSSSSEIKKALEIMKQSGKTKLILDLQDNPGGDVSEIVSIAGNFIYSKVNDSKELLVSTLKTRTTSDEYTTTVSYDEFFDRESGLSIVVLTNGSSASASEMLLGVMLDYGTCVQVGTKTYGKGIAQTCKPILKGSFTDENGKEISSEYAIYYTFAYYYTPSGANIHKVGFVPDEENLIVDFDEQINRAIQILK